MQGSERWLIAAVVVAALILGAFFGFLFAGIGEPEPTGKAKTVTVEKTLPAETVETTREVTKEVTKWKKKPAKPCKCPKRPEKTLPETGSAAR